MDKGKVKNIKNTERKFREKDIPFGAHVLKNKDRWTNAVELENVLNYLNVRDGKKIIDLGCADGRLIEFISKKHPHNKFFGVDFAVNPLLSCKKANSEKYLMCSDICSLPLESEIFDYCTAIQVLQQIPTIEERGKALRAIYEILRKNATMVVTVLNQKTWYPVVANGKQGNLGSNKNLYVYLYDSHDLRKEIESVGFSIKTIVGINNLPGRYLTKLGWLGKQIDLFITANFKSISLNKGTYLLASCKKE